MENDNGLIARAKRDADGRQSPYFQRIKSVSKLDDEQIAIMALICDNSTQPLSDRQVDAYEATVARAQDMMPGGMIRSRQVLVTLAMISGIGGGPDVVLD